MGGGFDERVVQVYGRTWLVIRNVAVVIYYLAQITWYGLKLKNKSSCGWVRIQTLVW